MSSTWNGTPQLEPYATPRESALDRKARAFHEANPQVMRDLVTEALRVRRAGRTQIGISLLFERLRWLATVETTDTEPYRLNNSYRAWYAREIMAAHPELAGIFATRDGATDPEYRPKKAAVTRAARVLRAVRPVRPSAAPPSLSPSRLLF